MGQLRHQMLQAKYCVIGVLTNVVKSAVLLSASLVIHPVVFAYTDVDQAIPYTTDINLLRASLMLPTESKPEVIRASQKVLSYRNRLSGRDQSVEPLHLHVPVEGNELASFSKRISKSRQSGTLFDHLVTAVNRSQFKTSADGTKKIEVNAKIAPLIDYSKISNQFVKNHQNVRIIGSELRHDPKLVKELNRQLRDHFSAEQRSSISTRINNGESLDLDSDLLPDFAKRMVTKFTPYRGPNCFHAALAFHGELLTKSVFINVKAEEGYHRAMINYDELWRAIQANFYEVNPEKSELKYGDMLVFFELPKQGDSGVYFRWIRHAATYLLGSYTFSKGSKSADSPYSVKTLSEEWKTWQGFTKNLAVKVFRRSAKDARTSPPYESIDWVY